MFKVIYGTKIDIINYVRNPNLTREEMLSILNTTFSGVADALPVNYESYSDSELHQKTIEMVEQWFSVIEKRISDQQKESKESCINLH